MTLRVLIVDDEQPARDRLAQLLEDDPACTVVATASNGEEAVQKAGDADVVLLDIRMPGMSGLEAAGHINELDSPPAIIFTTAYDEYAIEAFEACAIGYVLKPVRRARLEAALAQAKRLTRGALAELPTRERRQHVCAKRHGELRLIPVDSITSFHADQKYVNVVHDNGEDLIDESLKSLEEEFADDFVRIHRSAIVAIERIEKLERRDDGSIAVVLKNQSNDNELVVSRRHAASVRRRLRGGHPG